MHNYEPVIGLEIHVRLSVETKLFCADTNRYGVEHNTLVSAISLAYPGTLPVLNREAISRAVKMGLATNGKIAEQVTFDRKNYFYPDLPKGYQLTQDRNPISVGGYVPIQVHGKTRNISLTKIHLEEDAGKLIHGEGSSLVDFNRAGTALIEIVTDPVLTSPEEAYQFMTEIRRLVQYLEVGNGNMEEGSLRCDANVSIRPEGSRDLGPKVELKNMNSMNNVRKAVQGEIERQISIRVEGKEVVSQTRSYDAETNSSSPMRDKETLTDYRYFPEPDLVPEVLDAQWIEELRVNMPETGWMKSDRFRRTYNLPEYEAEILTRERELADFFESVLVDVGQAKIAANWIIGPVLSYLNEKKANIESYPLSADQVASIVEAISSQAVSFNFAQSLHERWLENPERSWEELTAGTSNSDEDLQSTVDATIEEMAHEVALYRKGKKKLFGAIMGSLVRKAGREVDPKKLKEVLQKTLDNH